MRLTNGGSRLKGASGTSAYIIAACAGGAIAAVGDPRRVGNIVEAHTVESSQQDSAGVGQWIIAADRAWQLSMKGSITLLRTMQLTSCKPTSLVR